MGTEFAKLEARWRRERAERAERSGELRRRLLERAGPVLRGYGVRQVWLFGSVASGTAQANSDLDLLVVPVTVADFWPLRRDLEAALGHPVDLYTQDDEEQFVRKVRERGELIYEVQP
jgi:predicted nucleotidyltransferase